MIGLLSVLNCGAGDLEFRFRRGDETEVQKAKQVITDMLKRGYVIFVEVDGELQRVKKFDSQHECYVIHVVPAEAPKRRGWPKGSKNVQRVPMRRTRATAVAPISGG